jgi:heme exporter protein D
MMELSKHAAFVAGAYGLSALTLLGLIIWVVADYRTQKHKLAALEARGIRRRSARNGQASGNGRAAPNGKGN